MKHTFSFGNVRVEVLDVAGRVALNITEKEGDGSDRDAGVAMTPAEANELARHIDAVVEHLSATDEETE